MSKRVSFAAEDVESEVGVDSDPELQPEQSSQNKYRGSSRRNAISLGSGENLAIISRSRRRRFSVNLLENDNDTDREIDGNEGLALKDDKTYHHESDSDLSPTEQTPQATLVSDDDSDIMPPKKKAQSGPTAISTRASASKAKAKVAEEPKTPTPCRKRKTADASVEATPTSSNKKSKTTKDTPISTKTPPLATRVRRASAKEGGVDSLPIPKTEEDMTPADRMIWDERKKGKGWGEISEKWFEMTGQKPGSTTLPNRLTRIRENIGDWTNDDDRLMMKCHDDIYETFRKEVYAMTAEQMINKGGSKFSALSVEKRWKELNTTEVKDDDENDSEDDGEVEVRAAAVNDE